MHIKAALVAALFITNVIAARIVYCDNKDFELDGVPALWHDESAFGLTVSVSGANYEVRFPIRVVAVR